MATGNYGTVRPADVTVNDVEILYTYTENRESLDDLTIKFLDPSQVLVPAIDPVNVVEVLGGLYTLKLPTSEFGAKGFYSIIIRPKQIRTSIVNCGVLTDKPDIRGLVFDINTLPLEEQNRFENNNLTGFRIEYLSNDSATAGQKIPNFFTIITSNNRVISIAPAGTGNNATVTWSLNDATNYTFCTVTPSSAPSSNPNAFPFIGDPTQDVIITNTFFNPIMLEIEMVEYDDETLAYAFYSNQTKSLEDGIYTIYNFADEIYKQYNLYEVKDLYTGKPLYEVREQKTTIDPNKDFEQITNFNG